MCKAAGEVWKLIVCLGDGDLSLFSVSDVSCRWVLGGTHF